ncbi:nuclear envelope integral membrane protein 2 isoform X5 [Mustela putorius furo]|uniref:Nuclear envelope integral membrane protein 2 isoform X5 n=1 Tax=Mustela putorius furo TaxID=9669 RepID=A0A8U0NWJ2_MUSPF|nr:nuclear envelope integral membrane protein 2 isoform X5 [Mustela putorius furo]
MGDATRSGWMERPGWYQLIQAGKNELGGFRCPFNNRIPHFWTPCPPQCYVLGPKPLFVREQEVSAPLPHRHLCVLRCKTLKEMDFIKTSDSDCYCYNRNSQMEWKYMWSTRQVKITSSGLFSIVYITERHNCQYPETILSYIKCMTHNFWTPKESNEITIIINPYGETMCFSVKPVKKIFVYTISVTRNIVDFKLFLVFVAGVFLFFYAKTLSQSPIFFYSSGTVLGVLMTLVFVLLLVKRFIPKYSTFWALMVSCWFASVYAVCGWMEDLKWLWHENRVYVLGYVLMVGFVSFAVCYKHGPLVDERSVNLLAWTLRLLALVLIYCGVTVPQCSYAVMVLILSFRSLRYPLKAFSYVRCLKD